VQQTSSTPACNQSGAHLYAMRSAVSCKCQPQQQCCRVPTVPYTLALSYQYLLQTNIPTDSRQQHAWCHSAPVCNEVLCQLWHHLCPELLRGTADGPVKRGQACWGDACKPSLQQDGDVRTAALLFTCTTVAPYQLQQGSRCPDGLLLLGSPCAARLSQ
jgi:hypothetical protein